MFCLWLKLANLWNWDEIFRHNVTKTLSFSSVTSGTCWSFHYSNFEVPRGPCSSVSFVFTLVYYHHFSESDIFRHGVTKTLVQFLEKLLSGLEQGKNLNFFTRVSFYHYLSIIHQANIKNVLYSLFVGSSRPKLESKNWSPLYVNVLSYLFELFKNEKALFVLKAYVETVLINKFLKSLILIL